MRYKQVKDRHKASDKEDRLRGESDVGIIKLQKI